MRFKNRGEAAERLATRLQNEPALNHPEAGPPLVLAIPRGSVAMAAAVAERLHGELDVILVHKIGAPGNPEFAIGSITESGDIFRSSAVERYSIPESWIQNTAREELSKLQARRIALARAPVNPAGRTVIVVDDGLATGATMLAAVRSLRKQRPAHLIIASPVASPEAFELLRPECDAAIFLDVPGDLSSISQYYDEFPQVTDQEVARILSASVQPVRRQLRLELTESGSTAPGGSAVALLGDLTLADHSKGLIIFAHGSGSSRKSPRNRRVASILNERGFATLLFDLLTEDEELIRAPVFDIALLSSRLTAATQFCNNLPEIGKETPIGFFGASTGAAAALWAAAELKDRIGAVVSRGGRPDLAFARLKDVRSPTLLVVGSRDTTVLELNRDSLTQLPAGQLEVIEGATHLFEEPGTLDEVAEKAAAWFARYLRRDSHGRKVAA